MTEPLTEKELSVLDEWEREQPKRADSDEVSRACMIDLLRKLAEARLASGKHIEQAIKMQDQAERMADDLAAYQELARSPEALERYILAVWDYASQGGHLCGCPQISRLVGPCNCGFDELVAARGNLENDSNTENAEDTEKGAG